MVGKHSVAICKWSTEYKMSGYPHEKDTFITFWWKDIRKEDFIAICKIDAYTLTDTKCSSNIFSTPRFSHISRKKTEEAKIDIENVRYQGEGKCSFTTVGDIIDSERRTLEVIGNCA